MFNAPLTPSVPTTANKLFLYADDDPDDCVMVRRTVRKLCKDLEVRTVVDGAAAVDWLSGNGVYADRNAYPLPDLLLADLRMPRTDGFDLVRWVRSQSQLVQMPIVVYSDSPIPNVEKICTGLGATHFVRKKCNCAPLEEFLRGYMTAHGLKANPAGTHAPVPSA